VIFPTARWRTLLLAPALGAALILSAACGDDNDVPGGGGSNNPTGSDEKYVTQLCTGFGDFQDSFFKVLTSLTATSSEKDVQKALEKPIDDLVKAMERANPPKDVKQYHDDAVKQLQAMQKQIKSGNLDALGDDEGVFPDPPQDVQDRLAAAAANVKECDGLDLFES
jgi:ABC-type glycerol-3-phosphate transport system substrate-binding protein